MTAPYEDFSESSPAPADTSESVPFWGDDPGAWDTTWIGGMRVPGVSAPRGTIKRRIDRKDKAGRHGARVTYVGDDLAEFSIHVTLWTPEQLEQWVNLLGFFRSVLLTPEEAAGRGATGLAASRASSRRTWSKFPAAPVQIDHPMLAMLNVRYCHIMHIDLLSPERGSDIYTTKIHCIEYLPWTGEGRGKVHTAEASLDLVGRYGEGRVSKLAKEKLEHLNHQAPTKPSAKNATNPIPATEMDRRSNR